MPSTWPAPAATSQPKTSPTGIACASARAPPGSGTGPCRVQPALGAPAVASNFARSSPGAVGALRPAAQATTRPGSHETWTSTTPGSFAIALVDGISVVGAGANVARVAVGAGRAGVRLRPLLAGLARPCVGQPSVLRLEIGDDLLAFFAAERARAGEVLFRVAQEREQRCTPRDRIGAQHGELFGRGLAVDLGVDVHVELPWREWRRRRRSCHRSPLGMKEGTTCVPRRVRARKPFWSRWRLEADRALETRPFRVSGMSTWHRRNSRCPAL